jgi:heptosyltransferase-2
MRTPVVALFGATAPSFGFAPLGKRDVVIETEGLACRPCTIHGGDTCPITTFDCMNNISAEHVTQKVLEIVHTSS